MGIFDSLFGKRKKVESSETPVKWNIPISSNEDDYVRRCLEAEFQEEKEVRTFRSDAAFATVLTPLNSKEYTKAIMVGKQILPQFSDFDLAYTWLASAYRETNQIQNSKEILSEGLKKAKRKYFILTEMGETEWKSGNIDAALYWWSQALHCLSNNPIDYNAYLLLSYVAKGAGTEEIEKALLARVDAMRGGQIRLDSQTAERLTTLVKSKKSEAMKKVLYGLYNKYFTVKQLHKEEVVIPKAKVELFGTIKQDVGVTTTSLSLTDDIAKSLAVLDEAYLARYDEQLEKHVNDALDNISSKGEVGIKTLLDRLYRDMNIVGSVLHVKSFGEMDHNEWLKRQVIVDALGRAHATSAIQRLLALQTVQSSVKQFYDILLPAVKRALIQLGDTPQQDQPITKKCLYCGEEILVEAIKCKYCKEWLNKETKELQPSSSPTKAKQVGENIRMEYLITFGHIFKLDKKFIGKGKINISEEIVEMFSRKLWLSLPETTYIFFLNGFVYIIIFLITYYIIRVHPIINFAMTFAVFGILRSFGTDISVKYKKSELSNVKRSGKEITLNILTDSGKPETLLFRATNEVDAIAIENALQSK